MADEQLVSLNEIRRRYARESLELSTDLTLTVNIAIAPTFDDEGNRGPDSVLVNLGDEHAIFGFLEPYDGVHQWNVDTLATAFHIDPDARVWDVTDVEAVQADILERTERLAKGLPLVPDNE